MFVVCVVCEAQRQECRDKLHPDERVPHFTQHQSITTTLTHNILQPHVKKIYILTEDVFLLVAHEISLIHCDLFPETLTDIFYEL